MKNTYYFLIVIFGIITVANATPMSQQVRQPFNSENYIVIEQKQPHLAVSDNGKIRAYLRRNGDNQSILIDNPLTQTPIHQLTISDHQIDGLYFVNNTHLILDLTDNKPHQYNDSFKKNKIAHVYNVNTGKLFQLLNPHLRSIPIQPILNRIIGITDNGNYAFMPAYDNLGRYNLYKVNLNHKRSPRLHHKGSRQHDNFEEYANTL